MKYVVLNCNKVHQVLDNPSNITIEAPDNVEVGWMYSAGSFLSPTDIARSSKKDFINSTRKIKLNQPILFEGVYYDSDAQSLQNITAIVSALSVGIPLPNPFYYRSADNQNIPMSSDNIIALAAVMLQHVNTVYVESWDKKALLDTANTLEEINTIS